jgi:hypothetical protein
MTGMRASQSTDLPRAFLFRRASCEIARTTRIFKPDSRNGLQEAIKYRLDGSPLIGPEKRKKKAIRTADCLSEASFRCSVFF